MNAYEDYKKILDMVPIQCIEDYLRREYPLCYYNTVINYFHRTLLRNATSKRETL